MGIVGFSNEEFSAQITPAISTIEQYSEGLGSIAANLLIDQLAVEKKGGNYVVGKSSRRPEANYQAILSEKIGKKRNKDAPSLPMSTEFYRQIVGHFRTPLHGKNFPRTLFNILHRILLEVLLLMFI